MNTDEILGKYEAKYTSRYSRHGDDHRALGWPNKARVCVRHRVMYDVIRWENHTRASLLDFGCGLGHFLGCISDDRLDYYGLDIMETFVNRCKEKYPDFTFYHRNILEQDFPEFDYIMSNGVFTEKLDIPYEDMWHHFTSLIRILFQHARYGIAFNVMSSHVDRRRDDLFHVSMDRMAEFCISSLTRNFVIRNDYGFYEYTTYVYR